MHIQPSVQTTTCAAQYAFVRWIVSTMEGGAGSITGGHLEGAGTPGRGWSAIFDFVRRGRGQRKKYSQHDDTK